MQSKISSFNPTLFRKNLSRFWPLWVIYTVIWVVMLPLLQFTSSRSHYQAAEFSVMRFREYTLNAATAPAVTMALIFGVLFAMACFGYLCTARSVGMMHSFPLRREGLFLTNFLAGLFMQVSGLVAAFGLALLVQATGRVGVAGKELLLWLAVNVGLTLFFYSFGVVCAMFTGQILAIPAFYGALNLLAVGTEWLARNFSAAFLYGATGRGASRVALWGSPVVNLYRGLNTRRTYGNVSPNASRNELLETVSLDGTGIVWIYAAVGVVLAGLALVLYRRRRSETAGDTVAVGWAKPLFTYGVAVCVALGLGQGLYYTTWGQFYSGQNDSLATMLACMLAMGLVGYFGAEMLLHKCFRVLKTTWKGAVGLSVVLVLFAVGLSVDIIGFESRVPAVSQVESVLLDIGGEYYISADTQDPDLIARIEEAHQAVISEKGLQKERGRVADAPLDWNEAYMSVSYFLTNGAAVYRSYTLRYLPEDLNRPQSGAEQLNALYCDPEIQSEYLLGDCTVEQVTGGDFSYCVGNRNDWNRYPLTSETAQALFVAVTEDIQAGRMGQGQFLHSDAEKNTYHNDLELYYNPIATDRGNSYEDSYYKRGNSSLRLSLTTYCTSTLAALHALGVLDEGRALVTEAEVRAAELAAEKESSTAEQTTILLAVGAPAGVPVAG